MTDVTTLPNAGSGDLAAGYVYLWVPGTPPTQCKVAISDLVSLGISTAAWKEPVRAASTANVTLASGAENGDTIDGVVLVTGDRILLKNQTASAENGIYVVNASGSPSRASDAATGADLVGAAVLVEEGTSNADALFVCTTNAPITLGTTGLTWSNLSPSGSGQEWAPNFSDDGDVYIPSQEAMTIGQGNAAIGTGTITFAKSTNAAPGTFSSTTLPATLEAGAWLKVSAASVSGFCATHLVRTA